MSVIVDSINSLGSFEQSFLGACAFAITSIVVQWLYRKAKAAGGQFWDAYTELDVQKHILHKHYVRSSNVQLASYGSSIALLIAARWASLSVLALLFAFGVNSLIIGNWIYVVGSWISFNWMLEARNWIRDSSDPKSISHVDEQKVLEITEQLLPKSQELPNSEDS